MDTYLRREQRAYVYQMYGTVSKKQWLSHRPRQIELYAGDVCLHEPGSKVPNFSSSSSLSHLLRLSPKLSVSRSESMHSFQEFRDPKLCLILESGTDADASGEGDEEENDEDEGTEENG